MHHIEFYGKKALVRVDFNVPLDENYKITDDTRIRAALPTIQHIIKKGGALILVSHLGRPLKDRAEDGSLKRNKYSLVHLVDRLAELTQCPVHFVDDVRGEATSHAAKALNPGEILLLENTRFYEEEKKGDRLFAKELAKLADVYINDAFGTAHRAHASTATVASFFEVDHKAPGFLMQRELDQARRLTDQPTRPFVAIIGGAKVSDKILLIEKLLTKVDAIVIGGGMAYTFLSALGADTGKSLVEEDKIDLARQLLSKAKELGIDLLLPEDSVCANEFSASANAVHFDSYSIPADYMGLDIGPKAISKANDIIRSAKTIFWNGPMGVFEFPSFAQGTLSVAQMTAEATAAGAFSLIGGGDSVAAINQAGLADQVSFISTGGGAMLTLLEGGSLPGVDSLAV